MNAATSFPQSITMDDDLRIPMDDGVHLTARVWRPVDADVNPVPAILEFLPYRRRDGTADRDAQTHPYFAGHGYASVRVDMRGSGDSEGVLKGEYLQQEQDDALAILHWLERQPWCTGKVGMIGISWGGFNGLQVAARRPSQLKAVVSICSTDDRYADDIHYMGGCLLLDKFTWVSTMFSLNAAPPDPASVGDAWRELWLKRLDESGFWLAEWLRHQRRDAFWKHGSVCEDWSAIQCAVYAVGGWADGYTNAVGHLLANLQGPKKGLIGPWAHKYPHFAKPGPQIGFLKECLRWWDYWLKGIDTGIMDEPMLRSWIEEPIRPAPYNAEKPGRWVADDAWLAHGAAPLELPLSPGRLGVAGDGAMLVSSPMTTGLGSGKWCAYGSWADQPLDQRCELGGQIVFDSGPLDHDIDMLGTPRLQVTVSSDKPNALIAVTLCEVFPDGAATRISYGLLNLTHRNGHEIPEPLVPGTVYPVEVRLCDVGHRFGAGNRIRIAVSNTYWHIAFPSPEANALTVHCAGSAVLLPVRPAKATDVDLAAFAPPETLTPLAQTEIEPGTATWTTRFDAMTGLTTLQRIVDDGWRRIDGIGLELGTRSEHTYNIHGEDPVSARLETNHLRRYRRGAWAIIITSHVTLTATRDEFHLAAALEAREGDTVVRNLKWDDRIPRDHV